MLATDRMSAWLSRAAPRKQAYLLAALIGLLVNLLAFGPGHLLGTSSYWDLPQEDSRAYLIGYRYFLHEPWHWPPFTVHTMNVPYTKSIVFSDAIPLFAALNKVLGAIIPGWASFSARDYLGVWHGLDYMLQAALGVCVLRSLGKRSYGQAIVASVVFLCVPAFIFRYGHASLSAQYLLLAGLALYLRQPSGAPATRAWLASFTALLFAAAMINPYHVAMDFALLLAALVRTKNIRSIVVGFVLGLSSVGLGAATAGFFASEAKVAMFGFDESSANLLSPFVPVRSLLFGDGWGIANPNATPLQYEGYAYLGLGVLALLGAFLIIAARSLRGVILRHRYLFIVALGAWVYSLSNHIWFGGHRIVAFDLPQKLHWVTEQYRAPGRFIWLPMYTLIAFLLRWSFDALKDGWRRGLFAVVVVAQVLDGGLGDWAWLRSFNQATFKHVLPIEPWRTLVHAHETVEIDPPYDCILDGTPMVDQVSLEIQFYASQKALPINGVYSARPTRNCEAERLGRANLEPVDGRLYVFLRQAKMLVPRFDAMGAKCTEFSYGHVCSKNAAAVDAALAAGIVQPLKRSRPLSIGQRLSVADRQEPPLEDLGWSWTDDDMRWSMGSRSSVPLYVVAEGAQPRTLKIEANAALCGARHTAEIDVLLDGARIGTLHFGDEMNDIEVAREIAIPDPKVLSHPAILDFAPRDPRSPADLGCNEDHRALGIRVRNIWVE